MDFSLAPLLAAPIHIQIHAFAALAALFLGIIQLIAPKGTLPHKALGKIWVLLMITVTVSSAFIIHPREAGESFLAHFSVIHFFTVFTAIGLIHGIKLLMSTGPDHRRHARLFIALFFGGLVITGAFTLLPGRIMHAVVFGY